MEPEWRSVVATVSLRGCNDLLLASEVFNGFNGHLAKLVLCSFISATWIYDDLRLASLSQSRLTQQKCIAIQDMQ